MSAACTGHLVACEPPLLVARHLWHAVARRPYRCPYYRFAEDQLYGHMTGVADEDTTYWAELATITTLPNGTSAGATAFITVRRRLRALLGRQRPRTTPCLNPCSAAAAAAAALLSCGCHASGACT